MNSLGGAHALIFEQSPIGGGPRNLPPPPLIAGIIKVTISYKHTHRHTDTNMHTNKHTCITVIIPSLDSP